MYCGRICIRTFAATTILTCSAVPVAFGDSSGLNNMPTADTTPDRTLVFQYKAILEEEAPSRHFGGFKMGMELFDQKFEWGVDGWLGVGSLGDNAGPAVMQLKWSIDFTPKTALGLGIANIGLRSQDRDDMGQPFKYAVVSHDFESFRAHAGYGLQQDSNTALLGLDTTVELFDRDLMLRTDLTQIDDEDQWLGSLGFIYFIDEHFAVESWVSQPFDSGKSNFTIKLNFAITF